MISAILILNQRGEVLIARSFREDVLMYLTYFSFYTRLLSFVGNLFLHVCVVGEHLFLFLLLKVVLRVKHFGVKLLEHVWWIGLLSSLLGL
jgi:hypothetical protein